MLTASNSPTHRHSSHQKIHAAQIPEALLKIQTVQQLCGISSATIRRRVKDGTFPAPVKLGSRCTRWVAGEVTEWLRQQAGK